MFAGPPPAEPGRGHPGTAGTGPVRRHRAARNQTHTHTYTHTLPRKSPAATDTASSPSEAPGPPGPAHRRPGAPSRSRSLLPPVLSGPRSSSDGGERIYVGFPKIWGFGPFGGFFLVCFFLFCFCRVRPVRPPPRAAFAREQDPASVSLQRRDGPINLGGGKGGERHSSNCETKRKRKCKEGHVGSASE